MNNQQFSLEGSDNILKSERLMRVFDELEVKARLLSKRPLSVSFSILFGCLFLAGSLIGGYLATVHLHLPSFIIVPVVCALTAAGLCIGNILSIGTEGRRLQRRALAIDKFVRPLLPLLVQINRRVGTTSLNERLTEAIVLEIESDSPPKRLRAGKLK